jgi:serine/threonine protein phosphatase PrpC
MPSQTPEPEYRPAFSSVDGTPTRRLEASTATQISIKNLSEEGSVKWLSVPPELLIELAELQKSSDDIDLLDLTASSPANDLVKALTQPTQDQSFSVFGAHFLAKTLDNCLLGRGKLTRFAATRTDQTAGQEVTDYYLPVIDNITGRIILIRTNLETKGRLNDLALKRSSEKMAQLEPRLDLPTAIKVVTEYRDIVGISHSVSLESAIGELEFSGRKVHLEAGSTIGGREGVDEDYSLLRAYNIPRIGKIMVASTKDGMGGHSAGEVASQTAARAEDKFLLELTQSDSPHHAQLQQLADSKHNGDLRAALVEMAIIAQNKAVFEAKSNSRADMGTTTTEFFIFSDAVYSGNVGDSRGYIDLGNGQGPYRVTQDHSIVESLVAAGQLEKKDAKNHPRKNNIFRCCGDKPVILVDVKKVTDLKPGTTFELVLGCDGFSGAINDTTGGTVNDGMWVNPADWCSTELKSIVAAHDGKPNDLLAKAVEMGMAGGVIDNITFMRLVFSASAEIDTPFPVAESSRDSFEQWLAQGFIMGDKVIVYRNSKNGKGVEVSSYPEPGWTVINIDDPNTITVAKSYPNGTRAIKRYPRADLAKGNTPFRTTKDWDALFHDIGVNSNFSDILMFRTNDSTGLVSADLAIDAAKAVGIKPVPDVDTNEILDLILANAKKFANRAKL